MTFLITSRMNYKSYTATSNFFFQRQLFPLRPQLCLILNDLREPFSLYSKTGSRIFTPLDFNHVSAHLARSKFAPNKGSPYSSKADFIAPIKSVNSVFYH